MTATATTTTTTATTTPDQLPHKKEIILKKKALRNKYSIFNLSFLPFLPFLLTNNLIVAVASKTNTSTGPLQENVGETGGIHWYDLKVSLKRNIFSSKKEFKVDEDYVLHPSSGFVGNGEICGIIGPSGAGKSTFLSALGGIIPKSARLDLSGAIWLQEEEGEKSKVTRLSMNEGNIAFLQQDDTFFSMLTPREILTFAANVQRVPSTGSKTPNKFHMEKTDGILRTLSLTAIQNRLVGDHRNIASDGKGLSGGERRRLSVALELIGDPKLFLADEPTTGLDSKQADNVVGLIRRLVVKGGDVPCILSLHQPRASIWKKLDSFILLAPGGKMCFMGKRDDAKPYFSDLGFHCPTETNPAEYFIDLVSIDTEDPIQASKDLDRINLLRNAFIQHNQATHSHKLPQLLNQQYQQPQSKHTSFKPIQLLNRFRSIMERSWRQNIRNRKTNLIRLFASCGLAQLFSQIFYQLSPPNNNSRTDPQSVKGISDRIALLSYSAISMSMMALMKTLDLIGREKPVVTRERVRNLYTPLEYLLSKVVTEIPADSAFAVVFSLVLKWRTGLRIGTRTLWQTLGGLTVCAASMGLSIGSFTDGVDSAMSCGVPLMVVFMVVGIINPSGVDPSTAGGGVGGRVLELLKRASPIKWAVEALCIAEFEGMEFDSGGKIGGRFRDLPRMGALALVRDGNEVLKELGLGGKTHRDSMQGLAILTGVNLCMSLVGLVFFTRPDFVVAKEDFEKEVEEQWSEAVARENGGVRENSQLTDYIGKVPFFGPRIARNW